MFFVSARVERSGDKSDPLFGLVKNLPQPESVSLCVPTSESATRSGSDVRNLLELEPLVLPVWASSCGSMIEFFPPLPRRQPGDRKVGDVIPFRSELRLRIDGV